MNTRPVIGITTDHTAGNDQHLSPHSYTLAVQAAGGLPLLLPYRMDHAFVPQLLDLLDGIVFAGGNDLDPTPWGEPVHPQARPVDPNREAFERALVEEVRRRRTPALGICLGSQLMNVSRGGSLIQFVPDRAASARIEHRKLEDRWGSHDVTVERDSLLGGIVGSQQIVANSSHKQAVARLGSGLRIVATAPDGIIEGIEDPSLPFFLGVQWHPERLIDSPTHLALFRSLVEASRG